MKWLFRIVSVALLLIALYLTLTADGSVSFTAGFFIVLAFVIIVMTVGGS